MKDIYEFGNDLLNTKDLDPVYVVIHGCNLPVDYWHKWLIAYWSFYHVGTATWISEVKTESEYWDRFRKACESKDYPRSSERRHFRGRQAVNSYLFLQRVGVAGLWKPILESKTSIEVMNVVSSWVGFGPWISFKVADMVECLNLVPISFELDSILYDSPLEGLKRWLGRDQLSGTEIRSEIEVLKGYWKGVKAPPSYTRDVGYQEVETILCKWNSYRKGSYKLGCDVAELRHNLVKYGTLRNCQKMYRSGKENGLWGSHNPL